MTARRTDSGIALITTLLLLMLASAMLAGFTTVITSDATLRGGDRTQMQAFYAAHGALEKLTADMGNLFLSNVAPTSAQIHALEASPPSIAGVDFLAPDGASGYVVTFADAAGRPVTVPDTIDSGPYQGMIGLLTQYTLGVTARAAAGHDAAGEVALQRRMQTVAIPVFQFGVFAERDLAFHAGSNFNFGGRVHTNGNLYLAASNGFTLTLAERVTAVGDVIRTNIENGWATVAGGYNGTVSVLRAPNTFRNLASNEGSVVGNVGSAQNEPAWTNLSIGTYNGNIRNGRTGARTLTLPFVSMGATPVDLIRRGVANEPQVILDQRYYSQASLRILLSDSAAELTALPGATGGAPVPLDSQALLVPLGYAAPDPLALSGYETNVNLGLGLHDIYRSGTVAAPNTALHGGFIKIEMQRANGTWQDVTLEVLNLGISGRNQAINGCADPSPNAVIRIQRIRNVPSTANQCGLLPAPPNPANTYSTTATDYWPMTLYDAREGLRREAVAINLNSIFLGGVIHYVELDARNLSRWFQGQIGVSGNAARNVTGYAVYFSDRRNNRTAANLETGQYGAEDFVNPASPTGVANTLLDAGEDVNGNNALDTYGQTPSSGGAWNTAPAGAELPLTNAARPWTDIAVNGGLPEAAAQRPTGAEIAQANRAIIFRRALKLTNGGLGNLVAPGLTVSSENPVYVQGNWNASAAGFNAAGSVASSIVADAITLLSGSWNDVRSFTSNTAGGNAASPPDITRQLPNDPAQRPATQTWYRMAVLSGKALAFPFGGGAEESFGADGGVHNFLRMLENWNGTTINYRGSIASFFVSQQATGIFKCCQNVYVQPTIRNYSFDSNFLNPALLPPLTPMFRDLNTTGFTQVIED